MSTLVFPHEIPSSLTPEEGRALAELAENRVVLELGAFLGRSTIILAQTALKLHSVDHHRGDAHAGEVRTLDQYLGNLRRYGLDAEVVTHIGRFEDVLPALCPQYFDLVFLDGFHTQQAVERDLVWARAAVKPDGVIACHDYGVTASNMSEEPFGVREALLNTFPDQDFDLVDTLAIIRL